ncbi:MAG: type II toxin-antitoxin system RelE/ParE family toxin [Gemmatimonadota bacterium]
MELADGSCPVGEFLDGLPDADRKKLDVQFERLGEHGKITNPEKFRKLTDSEGIFEFKSFQIRILCFFARDKTVFLAHAIHKKKDKHSAADIGLAEERRRWFLSHTGGGR